MLYKPNTSLIRTVGAGMLPGLDGFRLGERWLYSHTKLRDRLPVPPLPYNSNLPDFLLDALGLFRPCRVLESGTVADLARVLITSSVVSSGNSSSVCIPELVRDVPALLTLFRVPGRVALFSFSFPFSISSPLDIRALRKASMFSSADTLAATE